MDKKSINNRFIEAVNFVLSEDDLLTKTAIADALNIGKSRFSEILNERMNANVDIIANFCTLYDINADWLLTGKGEISKKQDLEKKKENKVQLLKETIQEDDGNIISIPVVDISAAAGYGYFNSDTIQVEGNVILPKAMFTGNGLRYCVRIKGQSMTPTLQDSDFVIVRYLHPGEWLEMKDERVYMIVTKDGTSFIKRVKNRLSKGFIVLTSDNIEKGEYPNFNLQADEIHNIFYAEWHFSAKMQNINETYYDRVKTIEDDVEELKRQFKMISK